MDKLLSPGVSVEISSDPISAASPSGTVPLFFIATAQDKLVNASGSIASGTVKNNANRLLSVTSQRDVLEMFGSPIFQKNNGTPVQGDELNEYGLHSLYSYLGVSNRAYVVRADLDLNELAPTSVEPTGNVRNGTMWLNSNRTQLEAYIAKNNSPKNYNDWEQKLVSFVVAEELTDIDTSNMHVNDLIARFRPSNAQLLIYKYTATGLTQVDTIHAPINNVPKGGEIWIRRGFVQSGASFFGTRFVVSRYASISNNWIDVPVYSGNNFYEVESQSAKLDSKYIASIFDSDSNSFSFYMNSQVQDLISKATKIRTTTNSDTSTEENIVAKNDGYLTIKYLNRTSKVKVIEKNNLITSFAIVNALNSVDRLINDGFKFISKDNTVQIINTNGYSFVVSQQEEKSFEDVDLNGLSVDGRINYSLINPEKIEMKATEPRSEAKDGTLWYDMDASDSLTVSMYISDYDNAEWKKIKPTEMYVQFDEPMANRLVWVRPLTQGIDGYEFYRNVDDEWMKLNTHDNSTINGLLFDDFTKGEVPSAELYMNEMLAVDLGQTEGVIRVRKNGRWEVASGVDSLGAGVFGRAAQRKMVVEAIASSINLNEEIRAESVYYNLIVAPAYVEVLADLIKLNTDIKEKAFIITDVPVRLKPVSHGIQEWATNAKNAPMNGVDGRLSKYSYAAQYMGWGYSTNVDGSKVVVPASTLALAVYAYNDNVSYVWYPPAGTQRGLVRNADSVGYITEEGDYEPVSYNQGQRDTMYQNQINPIRMSPNRGLVVYGDKTLTPEGENDALSRVNVARLSCYIKREIELMSEQFIYRLNTPSTRLDFTGMVNNFLAEIVQLEGLSDFLVVCDESNNTLDRINRNEMWMDIAIVPTKSINFIYVPIRLKTSLSTEA